MTYLLELRFLKAIKYYGDDRGKVTITNQIPPTPLRNPSPYSIIQAVLASCTALVVLIAGLFLLVVGLFQFFGDTSFIPGEYPIYSFGIIVLTIGATLIPFAVLKIKSLSLTKIEPVLKSPTRGFSSTRIVPLLLVLWVTVLLTGYLIADKGMLSTLIMPLPGYPWCNHSHSDLSVRLAR